MEGYHEVKPLIGRTYHETVLLQETLKALDVKPGNWYLDSTLGDGGLSLGILKLGGFVVGLDVDPEALERAKERVRDAVYSEKDFVLIRGNFRDIDNLQTETGLKFKGVIFDLGVSSLQLESPERGFSFKYEGPLDMRMDPELGVRAIDLLNALSRKELHELFTNYGGEKLAGPLADALVLSRQVIKSTKDLADLVEKVYRRFGVKSRKIHPATRVFQALRIVVNNELGNLQEALPKALEVTEKNGNIIVISFHSLEDRIVKDVFKNWQSMGLGVALKKPIVPGQKEIEENPRSRSAKLRVFKKT